MINSDVSELVQREGYFGSCAPSPARCPTPHALPTACTCMRLILTALAVPWLLPPEPLLPALRWVSTDNVAFDPYLRRISGAEAAAQKVSAAAYTLTHTATRTTNTTCPHTPVASRSPPSSWMAQRMACSCLAPRASRSPGAVLRLQVVLKCSLLLNLECWQGGPWYEYWQTARAQLFKVSAVRPALSSLRTAIPDCVPT